MRAQSISFFDLTNLTNLTDGQAHTYLSLGNVFKQQYLQEINGKRIEHFRSISGKVKEQTITIGENAILSNGTILRTVTYQTSDPQHIVNLIAQARRAKLIIKFQGQDEQNNIYKFDNEFYLITMLISTTENKGSVVVTQKEFSGY
jgi:CO dehydrogenase/acetyl-CoA synthase epsilon subunit